jgi:hypothetical protein
VRTDVVNGEDVRMFSAPAARPSCSKRRRRSASTECAAGSTLIATSRPSRASRAQ